MPTSWVSRLADIEVEWLESLWSLDDAAHNAGHVPAWVEITPGERAIDPAEVSWARCSRILARLLQQLAGVTDVDDVWDKVGQMDVTREVEAGEIERVKERCRKAIVWAVTTTYGMTDDATGVVAGDPREEKTT